MSLSRSQKIRYAVGRAWNQSIGIFFRYDIYGVKLMGIQITPKEVADILKRENGGEFSGTQKHYYHIHLIFNSYYVFVPRLTTFLIDD